MRVPPFDLERWQSIHEHEVEINLSESGVEPLRLDELTDAVGDLLGPIELGYAQTNGTGPLRERIAALYPGTGLDEVVVTNGSAEANFICAWHLLEPGDEVIAVQPNYMQVAGAARSFGATIRPVWLTEGDDGWQLDLDAVAEAVGPRTRLIVFSNPNNPTGSQLDTASLDRLCDIAATHDCWVLADEVYRGAELSGPLTETARGRYDKTLVVSGLSKAYGLPGLRIGWVVGPSDTVADLWGRRDYTSIVSGTLSDRLAQLALDQRGRLRARTREILLANQAQVARWVDATDGCRQVSPQAGGVTLIRYAGSVRSAELAETLRVEHGVLIVPGSQFDLEGYLRVGIGGASAPLAEGLARLALALSR